MYDSFEHSPQHVIKVIASHLFVLLLLFDIIRTD